MGYTHYFPQTRDFTRDEWLRITKDTKRLFEAAGTRGIRLRFEHNSVLRPQAGADSIRFNGAGDEGYETFLVTRQKRGSFAFCKTARKPYDTVVCAVLLLCQEHAPGALEISSDGDYSDAEWREALGFFHESLPGREPVKIPALVDRTLDTLHRTLDDRGFPKAR